LIVQKAFSNRLRWPNPLNDLSVLRRERIAAGLEVLDFSESNPTRIGLAVHGEDRGVASGDRSPGDALLDNFLDHANLVYDPDSHGLLRAREAIAQICSARAGQAGKPPVDPTRLFLCASTSEAYAWIFKLLCDPGDSVLVPRPGYPLFDWLAGLEGLITRPYRLEYAHPSGWRIDLDSVERAAAEGNATVLVLINPNNPTGSYIGSREREELLRICERRGIAIISDEVFFDFPVEGGYRSSFSGEERVLCFVLDGFSKLLGLPQMKLGWILASGPGALLAEAVGRLEIVADTYLSAGTPIMNAAPALLRWAIPFAATLRERLSVNLATLRRLLESPDSPHRVLRCEAGWTAIIESPRLLPEQDLALGLLGRKALWSHPGHFFDMEREACFTAGLILPPAMLEEGARRYRGYFEDLML
jgi:alanine-synthesizing transaminase